MFWVPIAFACLMSGDCVFVKYESEMNKEACEKAASGYMQDLEKEPVIRQFEITCIQVKPPEMI